LQNSLAKRKSTDVKRDDMSVFMRFRRVVPADTTVQVSCMAVMLSGKTVKVNRTIVIRLNNPAAEKSISTESENSFVFTLHRCVSGKDGKE